MRLSIPIAGTGWSADAFRELLRRHQIMEEYLSESGCVLLFSPMSRQKDFDRVEQMLKEFVPQSQPFSAFPICPSEKVMGLREAFLAPKQTLPVEQAEEKLQLRSNYLPAGHTTDHARERLHKYLIKILKNSGISDIDVVN